MPIEFHPRTTYLSQSHAFGVWCAAHRFRARPIDASIRMILAIGSMPFSLDSCAIVLCMYRLFRNLCSVLCPACAVMPMITSAAIGPVHSITISHTMAFDLLLLLLPRLIRTAHQYVTYGQKKPVNQKPEYRCHSFV